MVFALMTVPFCYAESESPRHQHRTYPVKYPNETPALEKEIKERAYVRMRIVRARIGSDSARN